MNREQVLATVEGARDEIVELTRSLVALQTVNTGEMPTGNETMAAELLRGKLAKEGFEGVEVLGRTPERGNLVARLPGASGQSKLLLISHTDVVPVGDAATWTRDPFGGEIADGRLYGRGSSDMKGTAAAEVMALILLKRAGVAPRHTITLTCVADEEAGGAYGMGWLVREHGERVRSDYSLNEGGGGFVSLGGKLHCMVGLGEKGRYEVVYDVHGRAAHAAHPWRGENAFFRLGQLLRAIEAYRAERRTDNPFFAAV